MMAAHEDLLAADMTFAESVDGLNLVSGHAWSLSADYMDFRIFLDMNLYDEPMIPEHRHGSFLAAGIMIWH